MNRLFDIVTLSDKTITTRNAPILKTHYLRHGNKLIQRKYPLNDFVSLKDPVSVILGGVSVISQILPNVLGSQKATPEDFLKLFPGAGNVTTRFRNYLSARIKYQKDIVRDLPLYTHNFIKDNLAEFSKSGVYDQATIDNFYSILRREAQGGGSQIYPNIYGTDWQQFLPYVLGGIALIALLKSKKRK